MNRAPVLILGVGNPSRGDDALGALFIERIESALAAQIEAGHVECLTDFQLQIENALDLEGREQVLFVDASVRARPPFEVHLLVAAADASVTSHALSPAAVLDTCRRVLETPIPAARVLAIRGESFELGEPLSRSAAHHLEAALAFCRRENGCPESAWRLDVQGVVQGVGFRPFLHRLAHAIGLSGSVHNSAGGLQITVRGYPEQFAALRRTILTDPPPEARIEHIIETAWDPATVAESGFVIASSDAPVAATRALSGQGVPRARLSLPPDLSVCERCLADVDDPASRFFGYAFTSCTDCGPRYSIARRQPFDREHTSMDAFPLCADCRAEYTEPASRRFHAQTLACPACGPRLVMDDGTRTGGSVDAAEPMARAVAVLLAGRILAVQGLGGFHLMCDATSPEAVATLRKRKHREHKPFAVLIADAARADALGALDSHARAALDAPERPIVLVPARPGGVASGVFGPSNRIGLMRPSTPLHHLLARGCERPLVMTSGNRSGEPIARTHEEARATLASIADAWLLHDRDILHRAEDPVVAARPGVAPQSIRRARGQAPRPIRLPVSAPEPVLAVGGHLKNTACLVVGDEAWLTPHLGDLETEASIAAFETELASFETLFGVRADVLAHDLHPEYAATRYALARPARRRIGVQHHVAHALAVVAETHVEGPVIAGVFDGTGFGTDGAAWGGEFLQIDGPRWSRLGTLRPLALAGGEQAIREVWRVALAAVRDAFGEASPEVIARLALFTDTGPDAPTPAARHTVGRLLDTDTRIVRAHGLGRWFDALGALILNVPRAGFEGDVAVRLEEACHAGPAAPYADALPLTPSSEGRSGRSGPDPFDGPGQPFIVDPRPLVRAAVLDLLAGTHPAHVAARVHESFAEGLAAGLEYACREAGLEAIILTGGALQNRRLSAGLVAHLGGGLYRRRVLQPTEVPVNDGGLSLGQALAAVSLLINE